MEKNYDYLVIDSEAGMEHISRRTIQDVDVMFIVSDASVRGIRTVTRIKDLVNSLKSKVRKLYLVVTKASEELITELKPEIDKTGVELIGYIPFDEEVQAFDAQGRALYDLPGDSALVKSSFSIMDKINL